MEEIPEDIQKTADSIAYVAIHKGSVQLAADDIGWAILAERKRCAEIVKGWGLANGAEAILSPSTRGE